MRFRIACATAAALVTLTLAPLALVATANAEKAHPKHAATRWHTCVPRETLHLGIYQFDNDLFTGRHGPSCITVAGGKLTIDRNYRSQPGGVVAYPAERVGDYAWNRDPGSGFPVPVAMAHQVLRLDNTGQAGGVWIDDLDVWFARAGTPATDHVREMIIVTRWRHYRTASYGRRVKIGRRDWHLLEWKSGSGRHRWPLIRFVARRQTDRVTLDLAAFLRIARRHHWISDDMVVSSISDGSECWSGCRGLTDRMTVTDSPGRFPGMPQGGFST